MSILSNMNILLIILMLILFISQSDEQQLKNDDMCNLTREILCVKDVLKDIVTMIENINQTINKIQKYILSKIIKVNKFDHYITHEIDLINSYLPISKYHVNFFQMNNIHKKYLINLFLEAHNAMSFYHNSINDILNMNDTSSLIIDNWFNQIQYNLRYEIICQYRNILNIYSHEWTLINQINRIKFSTIKYQSSPSIIHDVHSIINIQLLQKWIQKIHSVINNLETKFF
ncbi:unnamed protein product [Rotaria sordida]|uniref:Uncharacterized protein n=1 Tax=Rotaria sordida TaxID=392033 RepID=A0A814KTS7_9BILA|nr:unnamed protein product [Rotaria sordida]CAF1308433.1 unnamed protein product [Rotaria sordida]CAF1308660.1 unnamed protein product [Rotaria sordida]